MPIGEPTPNSFETETTKDVEFEVALQGIQEEFEEKGYNWITKNYKDELYTVSISSEEKCDVYGEGESYKDAFRDAINKIEETEIE